VNSRRRAAEALVCCGLPAARGVCCPLCGKVARAAKLGKTAQAPTSPPPATAGPAFPKPTRAPTARKHLRPRNPGRARAAVVEDFGPLGAFVRGLPCCVDTCQRGSCDPAHVRSRGAGHHAWLEIDGVRRGNITPLCRAHHDRQGRRGIKTFEREHVLVLRPAPGCVGVPCSTLAEAAEVAGDWFEAGVAAGEIEAAPC
jgi:hypothetical protein